VKIRMHRAEDEERGIRTGRAARAVAVAVPLLLVNAVAFSGQLAFLRTHLPWPLPGQVIMAVALESVAVFLALHAHVAALANDSAMRLRLASYAFGAVIGAMNYSHYAAPGWRPTFPAVAVGLMSASSPWLWAVHSRRASRDQMMAAGLIEGHALRLGSTRWLWHPVRSARVMWHATWQGVTDPREAITGWDASRQSRGASVAASRPGRDAKAMTHHDAPALAPGDAPPGRTSNPARSASRRASARRSQADVEASALAVLARQPDIAGAELGRAIGASPRTGQRLLTRLNGRASGDSHESAT
jgi:hypothetical protein